MSFNGTFLSVIFACCDITLPPIVLLQAEGSLQALYITPKFQAQRNTLKPTYNGKKYFGFTGKIPDL